MEAKRSMVTRMPGSCLALHPAVLILGRIGLLCSGRPSQCAKHLLCEVKQLVTINHVGTDPEAKPYQLIYLGGGCVNVHSVYLFVPLARTSQQNLPLHWDS